MAEVVPCTDEEPFLYWLRFEWGMNGNPHAHGQSYVTGNPTFESIVDSQETKNELVLHGYKEAWKLQT